MILTSPSAVSEVSISGQVVESRGYREALQVQQLERSRVAADAFACH
jgi:hypothetical protein